MNDICDSIFIEVVNSRSKNVIIGAIYNPPGNNIDDFSDNFSICLDLISKKNTSCFLAGDI